MKEGYWEHWLSGMQSVVQGVPSNSYPRDPNTSTSAQDKQPGAAILSGPIPVLPRK